MRAYQIQNEKSTVGLTALATPMPIRAVVAFVISLSFAFLSLVASSDAIHQDTKSTRLTTVCKRIPLRYLSYCYICIFMLHMPIVLCNIYGLIGATRINDRYIGAEFTLCIA